MSFDRDHEYHSIEQLKPTLTENVASITCTPSENVDVSSISQPEGSLDATNEYGFPSVSSYGLPSSTQPNATHTYLHGNSQIKNLSPFPSLMVRQIFLVLLTSKLLFIVKMIYYAHIF